MFLYYVDLKIDRTSLTNPSFLVIAFDEKFPWSSFLFPPSYLTPNSGLTSVASIQFSILASLNEFVASLQSHYYCEILVSYQLWLYFVIFHLFLYVILGEVGFVVQGARLPLEYCILCYSATSSPYYSTSGLASTCLAQGHNTCTFQVSGSTVQAHITHAGYLWGEIQAPGFNLAQP